MRLKDKVAVISGGAGGIGAACVRRFAEEGACVLFSDIVDGGEIAAMLTAEGHRVAFVRADMAGPDTAAVLVEEAKRLFGVAEIAVCAAAVAPDCDFLALSRDDFERALAINLTGPMQLGQALARNLVAEGRGGAIVNISSTSGVLAGPLQASYCASKAGLEGLTRAMAIALAPYRIRVNALAPGATRTQAFEKILNDESMMRPVLSRTPLGRLADPVEQAHAALFLASDEASFVTGETLYADGGRRALNFTTPFPSRRG